MAELKRVHNLAECAQFIIKTNVKKLAKELGIPVPDSEDLEWDELVMPHKSSPVLLYSEDHYKIIPMKFSLLPSWSKEPKVKFATHNARLESTDSKGKTAAIYDKPTWKKPFLQNHCLVPISRFIEPIYSGEFAGHMVQFHQPKDQTLYAAGIWDHWVSPETGETIDSFSVITDDPLLDVKKIGHERSPLFLKPSHALEWLTIRADGPTLAKFLRKNKEEAHVEAESFRRMKPGWEKRKG